MRVWSYLEITVSVDLLQTSMRSSKQLEAIPELSTKMVRDINTKVDIGHPNDGSSAVGTIAFVCLCKLC